MLKHLLSIGLVLATASAAFAGAEVELRATDSSGTPLTSFTTGQQIMMGVWVTSDTRIEARTLQVDHRASDSALTLGLDIDNVNNGLDGIPNFQFNYGSLVGGTFPSSGLVQRTTDSTTGGYADFSNLQAGPGLMDVPATTLWSSPVAGDQLVFESGVAFHIGDMPVLLPAVAGEYTFDVLNADLTDINDGFRIDFGFDSPQVWSSLGDNPEIVGNSLTLSVVPEPATLLLLAVGGMAAIRRRKTA